MRAAAVGHCWGCGLGEGGVDLWGFGGDGDGVGIEREGD